MIDLVPILEGLGVERIREGAREITALCPMHKVRTGKVDSHPSWSINKRTGAHICFSCGYKGGLRQLYADLGEEMPEDLDTTIVVESAKSAVGKGIAAAQKRLGQVEESTDPEEPEDLSGNFRTTEDELLLLDPVPQRLLDLRYITREAAERYGLLWDKRMKCWVIPIRDAQGVLQGVQYKQSGVDLTLPREFEKSLHLFGLSVCRGESRVAIVESPLDAVRFSVVGVPAVASLGAAVSVKQCQLLARHFNVVMLAMDRDQAGSDSADAMERTLGRMGVPTVRFRYPRVYNVKGQLVKDPGEFSDDNELLSAYYRSMQPR